MSWTLDGKRQGQMEPHLDEWAGDTSHGTFSGLSDGSNVSFQGAELPEHYGPGGSVTVTPSGCLLAISRGGGHTVSDQS